MKIIKKLNFNFISPKLYIKMLLLASIVLALFFTFYKNTSSPPCVNSDEAAFGYNAYSILQTGKDEYGSFLPLRLKSFGEYKMPLYSYLSIPSIGVLGLNDFSIRLTNMIIAILFPVVIFFFVRQLYLSEKIAIISSLITSASLGLAISGRQAHEAYLACFLMTVSAYFFIRFIKKATIKDGFLFLLFILMSLFSYSAAGVYAAILFVYTLIHFYRNKLFDKRNNLFVIAFIACLIFFACTYLIYKPERAQSLFLSNTAGFSMSINELAAEGGSRIAYNKLAIGVRSVVFNWSKYYSPQFLAINGDQNLRFGFQNMAPITLIEYVFLFVGIYYLFRSKEKWRYYSLLILFIAPIPASLTWAGESVTRSSFLFVPVIIICSYGIYNFFLAHRNIKYLKFLIFCFVILEGIFLFYSWDFYFNHYTKRAAVVRSWQCGNKEMVSYVKNNYDKFDKFYISKKNGQPYIFLLHYLSFSPSNYQKQALLTAQDKYGFGQVEKFDKFIFSFPPSAIKEKNVVLIGYPDDFSELAKDPKIMFKKITIGNEDIFWIYEN